jgi:glutamine synthetase
VQYHLSALCAVTCASVPSYYRLRPNRWAPVHADVGPLDRGAAVRICPVSGTDPAQRARQFNLEFRVADATGNPYLSLAMLIQAGLDGIREARSVELAHPRQLPTSLGEALDALEHCAPAAEWLGADVLAGYLLFKRAEISSLHGLDESDICHRYSEVY